MTATLETKLPDTFHPPKIGLGKCTKANQAGRACIGTLETCNGIVRCSICHVEYLDHPVSKETIEFRQRQEKEKKRMAEAKPEKLDFAPGYGDRIRELEGTVFKLLQRVHLLEQRKK